jgi:hypothetical protein
VTPDRQSALFLLCDRALEGRLEVLLRSWSRARVSRRAAARLLADELDGIEVNPVTVQRWMAMLVDEEDDGDAGEAA